MTSRAAQYCLAGRMGCRLESPAVECICTKCTKEMYWYAHAQQMPEHIDITANLILYWLYTVLPTSSRENTILGLKNKKNNWRAWLPILAMYFLVQISWGNPLSLLPLTLPVLRHLLLWRYTLAIQVWHSDASQHQPYLYHPACLNTPTPGYRNVELWTWPKMVLWQHCKKNQICVEVRIMSAIDIRLNNKNKIKTKKNMSQSCHAHLFFGAHLIQQNSSFHFSPFFLFIFSPKYTLKDLTDKIKHNGQQTSWTPCFDLYWSCI